MKNWKKKQRIKARKSQGYLHKVKVGAYSTTESAFIQSLNGTAGNKRVIAQRLEIARSTVDRLLERPEWDTARQAYRDEVENGVDIAEQTVTDVMQNALDAGTRLAAAKYVLTYRRKEIYGEQSKLTIEGGKNPIRVLSATIDVTKLPLSIEARREMLQLIDEQRESQRITELQNERNIHNGNN